MAGNRLAATAFAAMVLAGCSHSIAGTPVASRQVPVATTTVPSPSAGADDSPLNDLVDKFASASSTWWTLQGVNTGTIDVQPVQGDITCAGGEVKSDAFFCHHRGGGGVLKYRPESLVKMQNSSGDLAVELVVAHEVGHAVQYSRNARYSDNALDELSADCFAGAFIGSEGVEQNDANAALPPTGLLTIPGAADAVGYGIVSYATGERGDILISHCLNYHPIR